MHTAPLQTPSIYVRLICNVQFRKIYTSTDYPIKVLWKFPGRGGGISKATFYVKSVEKSMKQSCNPCHINLCDMTYRFCKILKMRFELNKAQLVQPQVKKHTRSLVLEIWDFFNIILDLIFGVHFNKVHFMFSVMKWCFYELCSFYPDYLQWSSHGQATQALHQHKV